jgi:hypothetical protein
VRFLRPLARCARATLLLRCVDAAAPVPQVSKVDEDVKGLRDGASKAADVAKRAARAAALALRGMEDAARRIRELLEQALARDPGHVPSWLVSRQDHATMHACMRWGPPTGCSQGTAPCQSQWPSPNSSACACMYACMHARRGCQNWFSDVR